MADGQRKSDDASDGSHLEQAGSDPVERLRRFLQESGVAAAIIHTPADATTVPAAAMALGVHQSQIVKSLLFESRHGDVVLVVASGINRVDRHRLAALTGLGHLKLASPQRVVEVTGYEVGGMPPVGHVLDLMVVLDETVLAQPVVFGGGGRSDHLVRINPNDIARLNNALIADVSISSI